MQERYRGVNIQESLEEARAKQGGEQALYDMLSEFSCPKNPDVEMFLHSNSIEFA